MLTDFIFEFSQTSGDKFTKQLFPKQKGPPQQPVLNNFLSHKLQCMLFAQIHTPILIQLSKIRISQIFYEPDRLASRFHFWS